jgi:hypothetical protein
MPPRCFERVRSADHRIAALPSLSPSRYRPRSCRSSGTSQQAARPVVWPRRGGADPTWPERYRRNLQDGIRPKYRFRRRSGKAASESARRKDRPSDSGAAAARRGVCPTGVLLVLLLVQTLVQSRVSPRLGASNCAKSRPYGPFGLLIGVGANWRREWDSNPRYGFPHTRFPSVRLKPLGHLSGRPSLEGARGLLQVTPTANRAISTTY